jgi:carboxyl-terminal processing protease
MALEEAVHKMRGKPGTKVLLAIARKGEGRLLDIEIVRQIIRVESVRIPQILDPEEKIGYVSLTSFQEDTAEELEKALARLEGEGLRALVLDLRVNGGGRMDAAIKVANLFLDKGVIVSVKGRPGPNQHSEVYQATKAGTRPEYPLALLVNQSSASASEIVAGALRDHHRAVLVGERTFGKGSVQTLRDLKIGSETAGLKLTTAYYYTPSGQCIHKIGIEPDVKVPLDVEVLAEVMRRQHDKWVEQNAPKNGAEKPGEKPAEKPAPPPEKPAPPAAERTWDKPAPEGEGAPADGKAARDKARLVDLQLEAALTALRAVLVDRERGAPVRKYLPPEEKGPAAAAKTPPPPVPEPEPEPAPVE